MNIELDYTGHHLYGSTDLGHSRGSVDVRELGAVMLTVTEALKRRISTRQFLPRPLAEPIVREILHVARWAPSGGNLQPWKVIAVAGAEQAAVIELARRINATESPDQSAERPVYPPNLWEPFRTRRYKVGEDMYALLQIPRSDRLARLARFARNYEMFGAPVELFFVIDERMGYGQWAHLGMFMQSIALAALERGVSSCMQEAWATLRLSLKSHFALDEHELIYCGMALGYADETAAVNSLRSDRAPVDEFASFRGFG
jgi:nitroreductase